MARIFEKCTRGHYDSYQDFKENFRIDAPENFNFAYDVMDVLADEQPDKRAMLWTNVAGAEQTFTFEDLCVLSNKCANFLAGLGIQKGDMVMLILQRRYEFWVSMLALHKIGAVAIPATHLLTKKDIVYRNNKAGIKAIICADTANAEHFIDEAQAESPTLEHKIMVGDLRLPGWISFDEQMQKASPKWTRPSGEADTRLSDPMLLFFTSGTTGMPKMVMHNYSYALAHIPTAVFWHNVQPDGIHLTVSDTGWGKCLWGKFYGQWFAETTVFVYDYDKFVPPEMLEVISKYKITTFCAPPTIYRYFIKEDLSKYDLSNLVYATTAGEALNPEVFDQFKAATGIDIKEAFGQTETTMLLGNFTCMNGRKGSLGRPCPLYDADIVDDEGNSVRAGEVGEIVIRTDKGVPYGMFMGYYKDPELTRQAWHDGIYRTGDLAWRDEEGYYWYVGRADDVIKSSGYRIGPFEVESALMEHPAVLETAITGVPHPERGQVIKATVVLAAGYEPSEALKKELQDHVKRTTAPYKYPRIVEFVTELPKTISGKIKRFEIRGDKR